MHPADITIPETAAARAALDVLSTYSSPALRNHCVRSYLWAALYGNEHGITYDAELLYVAALLHDLGLVREFDSHTLPFEEASGNVAWVFAAGAGWPVERRTRVAEVITRHMWPSVDLAQDPEGHLLELATSVDISGHGVEAFPERVRAAVLTEHPRLDLRAEFVACFEDQAARKPDSPAARAVTKGIAARMADNPLDRIG